MRLEHIPIVLGVVVCVIAAGIIYDAISPENRRPFGERRRRRREEPSRAGEWFVGLGTLCMGVALIGRDEWRWGTIAVFAGIALLLLGAVLNRVYLREVLLFRGAARRGGGDDDEQTPAADDGNEPQVRLR